jgi:hypothetical protein
MAAGGMKGEIGRTGKPGRVRLDCIFRSFFNEFFDCPSFPGQLHGNGWRKAHSGVNFAEVVSANEYGEGVTVIVEGLGVSQRQPGKPLVEVSDGQILPFNVRRANPVGPGIASFHLDAGALWRQLF